MRSVLDSDSDARGISHVQFTNTVIKTHFFVIAFWQKTKQNKTPAFK